MKKNNSNLKNHYSSIDIDRLRAFFGNNSAAIEDFIQTFIDSTLEQLKEINNAIKNKDEKSAKASFHRLGGSAGDSGVNRLYKLCGKAEEKLSQSDWEGLVKLYDDIEATVKQLQSEWTETHRGH